MATIKDHYSNLSSDVYSWMFGGFEKGIETNTEFFRSHNITSQGSGIAIDLGCGCGFQSIPLARVGFSVFAIDSDKALLNELNRNAETLDIQTIEDNLLNFSHHVKTPSELVVCMTDTLLHLESKEQVYALFLAVFSALEENGKFIITFRDLSSELSELERFIPVRSDDEIIFTCFLEYEPEIVKVHDIVYKKSNESWTLNKSFYRKLRLAKDWIDRQLSKVGFNSVESTVNRGLVTVIATK